MRGPDHARTASVGAGDGRVDDLPRPEIVASWIRSEQKGLSRSAAARPMSWPPLSDSRVARAGLSSLQTVEADLAGTAAALVLADVHGRILHRTPTAREFAAVLDAASVVTGQSLAENTVGTNAVGTALVIRDLVTVVGGEHYQERFQDLAGIAMPVTDPVSGRVLGAVALLAPAGRTRPAHVALVRQTALLTEQRMLGLDAEAQQRVLARYIAAARAPGDPVFAVSEQTFHAGPAATRLLDGMSHEDLWPPARDALTSRLTAELVLMLPSGERVAVRLEAVEDSGILVGAIGEVLSGAPLLPPQPGGRVLSVPEFTRWSPAARRTATALRRAAEERQTVCVVGEDGVGKATTVRLVAARALPGRNLVGLDPDEATPDRVAVEITAGSPVLVTDAHTLRPHHVLALVNAARSAHGDGWLALTYQGQPDSLDETALGSRAKVIPASPLRARPQDIELVLPSMLRRYAAGRELRVSPAVVDRLRRNPWPTNFHGLEAVVAEMARNATSRVLGVDDLPEAFGAILRRRLTPMEWMTRSAIVEALRASGGNKETAAESLGMSRASIYRKIKAFGIDIDEAVRD